jgi:hypothetical protein
MKKIKHFDVLIIGGGAAGFFCAITCAETNPGVKVAILEKGREVLQKVKISGGGRCNVTHACFDPRELVENYPRGNKALLGPFHQFGPKDTVAWFQRRGVKLKTEPDGRMFPATDDSQTIVNCLLQSARQGGVDVLTSQNVTSILPPAVGQQACWNITTQSGEIFQSKKLMIATGSSPRIWQLLEQLGHHIVPPVPSLFTFNIKDARIEGLAGLSVPQASLKVTGMKSLHASGPLLITHWGMSGPAILRLSAWGAHTLHEQAYRFQLEVNWLSHYSREEINAVLQQSKTDQARKLVVANCPFPDLPKRLWEKLTHAAAITADLRWADVSKEKLNNLAHQVTASVFEVNGKSTFKEEFVTAGGVDLDEVDFTRFESKIHPALFLAGEVLDIDAITGGFNFQAAWTGGFLAGKKIADVDSE